MRFFSEVLFITDLLVKVIKYVVQFVLENYPPTVGSRLGVFLVLFLLLSALWDEWLSFLMACR